MNLSLILNIAIGIFLGLVAFIYHNQILRILVTTVKILFENINSILTGFVYILGFIIVYYLLTEEFNVSGSSSFSLSFLAVYFYKKQKDAGGVTKCSKTDSVMLH